jgi:hypothetical protein
MMTMQQDGPIVADEGNTFMSIVPKLGVLLVLLALVPGCTKPAASTSPQRVYVLDDANGKRSLVIRVGAASSTLENGDGDTLASFRRSPEGTEILGTGGKARGRVVSPSSGTYQVLEIAVGAPLFVLTSQADGDMKVTLATGERLYVIKKRDYGYKVLDAAGQVESRVRTRPGKVSVRDSSGATYLSTRQSIPIEAVTVLTLAKLPIDHAAGLALEIMRQHETFK